MYLPLSNTQTHTSHLHASHTARFHWIRICCGSGIRADTFPFYSMCGFPLAVDALSLLRHPKQKPRAFVCAGARRMSSTRSSLHRHKIKRSGYFQHQRVRVHSGLWFTHQKHPNWGKKIRWNVRSGHGFVVKDNPLCWVEPFRIQWTPSNSVQAQIQLAPRNLFLPFGDWMDIWIPRLFHRCKYILVFFRFQWWSVLVLLFSVTTL